MKSRSEALVGCPSTSALPGPPGGGRCPPGEPPSPWLLLPHRGSLSRFFVTLLGARGTAQHQVAQVPQVGGAGEGSTQLSARVSLKQ